MSIGAAVCVRAERLSHRYGRRATGVDGLEFRFEGNGTVAVTGPNGSGKSTLAGILAGREGYDITAGEVIYCGKDLFELDPEERAREGVFLAFQYPVEIPGVNSTYFLKAAVNEIRKSKGQPEFDAFEFLAFVKDKIKLLELNEDLLKRSVNEGFSGGEKKAQRNFPDGRARTQARHPRRNGFRPRH